MLIVAHDNPDPDSLSSAAALRYILAKKFRIRSKIIYGGIVGRAENKTMVQLLKIPAAPIHEIPIDKFNHFALVDTQPGTGNNSLPHDVHPTIVIDHHPQRNNTAADYIDIRDGYGATATLLTEYLIASELEVPASLATALYYGIVSETQNLGRDAKDADRQACSFLFPYTHKKILSKIQHPKLSRDYFSNLSQALRNAVVHRNIIISKLGAIQNPDHVPYIADLLLQLERMTWSFVIGQYQDRLLLSLRTQRITGNAGKLIQKLVHPLGKAGGHDMIAGGKIPCPDATQHEINQMIEELIDKFTKMVLHVDQPEWKPLLED